MALIGIITDPNNETYTRNVLAKDFYSQHEQIIFIHNQNINNIKNIRFETLLLDTEESIDKDVFIHVLRHAKNVIINSDIEYNIHFIKDLPSQVITFGFNQKSTVTISSVTNENILMCIQRRMQDVMEKIIEPQEIRINITRTGNIMPNSVIGVQILRIIYKKFDKF